ncbi:MAG: thioredoxin-dependent thiol peroxidase [Anaerolineales bacterium]
MGIPKVGETPPEFELQTDSGETVRLSDFRGKKVVLFFYPKAETPGCIKEACGFRDDYSRFLKAGIVVLGISPDTVRSQADFSAKYSLPYPLLADADHKVAEAYGVWNPKKLFFFGVAYVRRTTFVIDESGRISHVYEGVNPVGHSQEVFAQLTTAGS